MKKTVYFLLFISVFTFAFGQGSSKINTLKKELKTELTTDTARVSITLKIANLYSVNRSADSSLYYYNKALKLAIRINSKLQIAKIRYNIAIFNENNRNYKKAIENYLEAVAVFKELNKERKIADIYNLIGSNYNNLYAEDKAIEYYFKSFTIYEKIVDCKKGRAVNFIDIGNLYYKQENYEYAEKYFLDALNLYKILEDKDGLAASYTNLGNAIADAGDIEGGLHYYHKSIEIGKERDDQYGIAVNYNNIGDCYIEAKQYQKALDYLNKSLVISNTNNFEELISIVYLNIADVQNKLKKYQSAIVSAKKSLKIAKKIGALEYEVKNLENLLTSYEGLGNTSQTLKYHKLYKKIQDSLLTIDKTKRVRLFHALNELEENQFVIKDLAHKTEIAQIKSKSENRILYFSGALIVFFTILILVLMNQNDSKREANSLLYDKNYEIHEMKDKIQLQRDQLKQLNNAKDKFFSIIAHDLKNPFNSIKGFTELLIENRDSYDKEKRLKFLKIIKNSTIKVSNLLNSLLVWANIQSGNFEFIPKKIELKKQVFNIISFLEAQAISKDIEIINTIDSAVFVQADENMVEAILRNLISNAIKFTNLRGKIEIYTTVPSQANFVAITVKDNGIGIQKSDVENLFTIEVKNSTKGTENETGTGLGLILCKDFVEKNGGELHVKSTVNKGSAFTFTLPKWIGEPTKLSQALVNKN